jgi:hypothetical protein
MGLVLFLKFPLRAVSVTLLTRRYRKHAMSSITPDLIAEELQHSLLPVPAAARPILLEAITNLISKHVAAERTRCLALCEQRARLWRNTEGDTGPLAQEARFRANEAIYIADLLHFAVQPKAETPEHAAE